MAERQGAGGVEGGFEGLRETIGLCRGAAVAELPDTVKEKAQASISALLKTGHL